MKKGRPGRSAFGGITRDQADLGFHVAQGLPNLLQLLIR